MKCNNTEGLNTVCYNYDKCQKAYQCKNVPKGIKRNLERKMEEKYTKRKVRV